MSSTGLAFLSIQMTRLSETQSTASAPAHRILIISNGVPSSLARSLRTSCSSLSHMSSLQTQTSLAPAQLSLALQTASIHRLQMLKPSKALWKTSLVSQAAAFQTRLMKTIHVSWHALTGWSQTDTVQSLLMPTSMKPLSSLILVASRTSTSSSSTHLKLLAHAQTVTLYVSSQTGRIISQLRFVSREMIFVTYKTLWAAVRLRMNSRSHDLS